MDAFIWNCTEEQYHSDCTSWSRSQLEVFRYSPAEFYARYVEKSLQVSRDSKPLRDGSIFHMAILEPERFDNAVAVIPDEVLDKAGRRSGARWLSYQAANHDKFLITHDEYDHFLRMAQAVAEHPAAERIIRLQDAQAEVAIRFKHKPTGIVLRAKLDLLSNVLIADLKTAQASDPDSFARSVLAHGYHRQMYFYRQAVEALTGERVPFIFIVVSKAVLPTCEVYELDEEYEAIGRDEIEQTLKRLAWVQNEKNWNTPTHGQIVKLSPPRYAAYQDEYRMEVYEDGTRTRSAG